PCSRESVALAARALLGILRQQCIYFENWAEQRRGVTARGRVAGSPRIDWLARCCRRRCQNSSIAQSAGGTREIRFVARGPARRDRAPQGPVGKYGEHGSLGGCGTTARIVRQAGRVPAFQSAGRPAGVL